MPSITTKRDFSVGEPTDVTVTPKICSAPKRTSNSGFEVGTTERSLKPLARCKATMVGRNSASCASMPPNHRFEFLFSEEEQQWLKERNSLDTQLHQFANQLLDAKIAELRAQDQWTDPVSASRSNSRWPTWVVLMAARERARAVRTR